MECSQTTNAQNAARAAKERPGVKFALIDVSITNLDDSAVWFTTRGEDDKPHAFACNRGDVWLECPSTAQQVGDRGALCISTAGLATKSLTDGRTRIKGSTPDSTGKVQVSIKWPNTGGDLEPVASLEIWPTNITVEGYANGDPAFHGQVSLVNLKYCSSSQTIKFDNAGMITLSLTDDGFHRFSLPMPDSAVPVADNSRENSGTNVIGSGSGAFVLQPQRPGSKGQVVPDAKGSSRIETAAHPWDQLMNGLAAAIADRLIAASPVPRPIAPTSALADNATRSVQFDSLKRAIDRMSRDLDELKLSMNAS
jgi:hypothetical protein